MKLSTEETTETILSERQDEGPGCSLAIKKLSHSYGKLEVLRDISLDVQPGEIIALLGPSGSGKSTILRIIAGFIKNQTGNIVIDGDIIDSLPAYKRRLGMVFQNYALFPHLTVRENIGYGLVARRENRKEIRKVVDNILKLVRLEEAGDRFPRELSGGMQQRVATGRALAIQPLVLLLDEPFGALDKNLRLDMQIEFLKIQRQFGITSIIVTHDQEEALSIADRVVILNEGRIEQVGTSADIYDTPATLFVNNFVGSTNTLEARVTQTTEETSSYNIPDCGDLTLFKKVSFEPGDQVVITARPEHLRITETGNNAALSGTIDAVLYSRANNFL